MSYQKNSSSHYRNFGGVNEKSSVYSTQDSQHLNLRNLDFFIPNALSKTPGSTQGIFQGTSGPILSLFEFQKLSGESYLLAGTDSALFYKTVGHTLTAFSTGWTNGQPQDILTFANKAWIASGQKMISFDGSSAIPFGLPMQNQILEWFDDNIGISAFSVLGVTVPAYSGASTGSRAVLHAAYAYVRADGYMSPLNPLNAAGIVSPYKVNLGNSSWLGVTTGDYGNNVTLTIFGFTLPNTIQGVTAFALFLALDQFTGIDSTFTRASVKANALNISPGLRPTADISKFRFFTLLPTTTTTFHLRGVTLPWADISATFPSFSNMTFDFFTSFIPKYIDINNNSLVASGFSSAPSSFAISNVGEPEVFRSNAFFEVRTNDGDRVMGHKVYRNETLIFKRKSFHRFIGTDERNYQLVEVTTEVGCLSNQAIVEYNGILLFLDEQGIVEFNGADWKIISTPVEGTFRRMNVSAALEKAVATHYQERNQVWFGIPVDGSTVNNLTVVYDYLLGAWTFVDGFRPSAFAKVKQGLGKNTIWYGNPSGMISYLSPSFYAHNGQAFTCMFETAFDAPDGADVESMFRRLFLDVNQVSGVTGKIDVEVFSNYDRNTVRATFSVYQNQFQTRSEFGVGGRSVGFKMYHSSPSLPLTINGYDVHRKFLRKV